MSTPHKMAEPHDDNGNIFNQNEFSLVITETTKLKFSQMQNYLKDKSLEDETAQSFESFYTHILMGISFIFDSSMNILPHFTDLNKHINFRHVFLHNLIDSTKERCEAVFSKIGSILKMFLLSTTTISTSKTPSVDAIIRAYKHIDGWTILEKILKKNLVICGARPRVDEMTATYTGVNILIPIRKIFKFSGILLSGPSTAFTDNSAVHTVIDSERMTTRCRHLDISIAFLHQEKDRTYQLQLCRTMNMLADIGTKPLTPQYTKLFKYWATGEVYLPQQGSEHYQLLQMEFYETNFALILKSLAGNKSS